jgi:formylglycine-generating enzyme required for sulfatase activity
VDWCDAYAYCKWAEKRLCGKIGGGANAWDDFADPTKSEWQNACSAGGTRTFPYGDTYMASACNGRETGPNETAPVESNATCEGPFAGLFDLSGNVREWEDSCYEATGPEDLCRSRGGSWHSLYDTALSCSLTESMYDNREEQSSAQGFRCCADSLD